MRANLMITSKTFLALRTELKFQEGYGKLSIYKNTLNTAKEIELNC